MVTLVFTFLCLLVASLAYAQDVRPTPHAEIPEPRPATVELYDAKSGRTGSAVQRGERIDVYNLQGNRTGYGVERGNTIDLFDTKGNRIGFIKK
jgi:hypothetical protein